jgi:hypothetical protein
MRSTGISSVSNLPDSRTLPKKGLATWSARWYRTFRTTSLFRRRDWRPGRLDGFKLSKLPHPSEEGIGNLVGLNGSDLPNSRTLPKKGLATWSVRSLDRPFASIQKLSEENFFLDTQGRPE